MRSEELIRNALNTYSFSEDMDELPMVLAQLIAAVVQIAKSAGNSEAAIHDAVTKAWGDAREVQRS